MKHETGNRPRRKSKLRHRNQKMDNADDTPPDDPDEFRWALVRRMNTFMSSWRDCDLPLCRRVRACRGKRVECARDHSKAPPKDDARVRARLKRMLERRLDEIERKEAERQEIERVARERAQLSETAGKATGKAGRAARVTR
jgi:hypothetical protein